MKNSDEFKCMTEVKTGTKCKTKKCTYKNRDESMEFIALLIPKFIV